MADTARAAGPLRLGANGPQATPSRRCWAFARRRVAAYTSWLRHRPRPAGSTRIGFVSETNSLYQGMTVPQPAPSSALPADAGIRRSWTAPSMFGLAATHVPALRGMKTQLALCLALAAAELRFSRPTTGLDLWRAELSSPCWSPRPRPARRSIPAATSCPMWRGWPDHAGILRGRLVVSEDSYKRHAHVRLGYRAALRRRARRAQRRQGLRVGACRSPRTCRCFSRGGGGIRVHHARTSHRGHLLPLTGRYLPHWRRLGML
jgi:hypothetical protein